MSSSDVSAPAQTPRRRGARWACGLVGALLLADALALMSQGMFNVGVLIPFTLGGAALALSLGWERAWHWCMRTERRRRWSRRAVIGLGLWAASVAAFWVVLARTGAEVPASAEAPSAIVVLGSGTPHGKPSQTLAARLDKALEQAARFPRAHVLVSGGMDFREQISEGQVMGDYLRARGLPAERIVQEERSTSTEENLRFSQPLLAARGIDTDAPILVVTSDFHTLRARWIARRAGYADVRTAGARTPLIVRYNAWLREYFAVLSGFVLREF